MEILEQVFRLTEFVSVLHCDLEKHMLVGDEVLGVLVSGLRREEEPFEFGVLLLGLSSEVINKRRVEPRSLR